MNVSYNWLKKHVDLEGLTPEIVADKLTFSGAEVEGITRLGSGTNLVIGKIVSCVNHPDSDHLHVLNVDEGPFGVTQIVCGAPNAREGLKVIVARPGAKLPEVEIKPSVIRGVESNGMCCSLLELGVDGKFLSDYQKAGIEELPDDAPVGESDVLGYLGLDDAVLEISVLPNRPDLYALNNVAREVGCILSRKVTLDKIDDYPLAPSKFEVGSSAQGCPLFSGRVIKGVTTKESPKWLKQVLLASGIRSINNVVDIGNFVMLLTGQPLNMYDADKLPAPSLIVRDDLEGEFLAMDGNKYSLVKGDLVVTSGGKPMCLAGIMTAEECKVDENTKNIVVEAAYFAPASIRHTSNRIGLSSDSSLRFCKGINPHQAEYVQRVTTALLKTLCDAGEVEESVLYDTMSHEAKKVETDLSYINGRLGTSFTLAEVVDTLIRDYFAVETKGEKLFITVPEYRIDVDGKADISEEVIRILGYENVPSVLPYAELSLTGLTPKQQEERNLRRHLCHLGLDEVVTYTLVSKEEAKRFAYIEKGEPYVLTNPMTVDREVVRTHLAHSLLSVAAYNANRQNKSGAFFEVSDVDTRQRGSRHLGIVLYGDKPAELGVKARPYDFFDMKGILLSLFEALGIGEMRYRLLPWSLGGTELHPYQSAEIRIGKDLLGYFGVLHPSCSKKYDVRSCVYLELDLDALLSIKVSPIKASVPPRFPSVTRDLALLVPTKVTYEELRRELLRSDALIVAADAFDLYKGEGVEPGYVSIAVSLTLLSKEKTLSDAEVNLAVKKAVDNVMIRLGAKMRQ
ncbi:MAG: phenylalanine--tRNA ligase subunit beta [Erysipelotrichaceae bacterium]|nr:phenylalanine--tRNA ligase subunit beta [Erysipelotrichaceae bacterium]